MTTKKETVTKTQGAEVAKKETLAQINKAKKEFEEKMEFFQNFQVKVQNLQTFQRHQEELEKYYDALHNVDDPTRRAPKMVLQHDYNTEYTIKSVEWQKVLAHYLLGKIKEKAAELEKEISKIKLN